MIKEKKCSKCKEVFPATTEFFCKHPDTKDKLQILCRNCQNANNRDYYKRNREMCLAKSKEYQKKNRKHIREINRVYQNKRWASGFKYKYLRHEGKLIKVCRFLIAQSLNRELKSIEIVHHIDGNTLNDDISNLYLCKDQNEHLAIHRGDIILSR